MCEIQITRVTGIGQGLDAITVFGRVELCEPGVESESPLVVQIICPIESVALFGPGEPFAGTVFDASAVFIAGNGDFYATFNQIGDCRCGGQMLASAHCAAEPDCRDEMLVEVLECTGCPVEDEGIDDVGGRPPECDEGATALVTLGKTFTNATDSSTFLMRFMPNHPDAEIVSITEEQINAGQTRTVTAVVRYPTRSTPQPYFLALDTQENPTGCPPYLFNPRTMPDCCPDVQIVSKEVDGCRVTINVEPVNVPDGCEYRWNFYAEDPSSPDVPGSSQFTHIYEDNGDHEIEVFVTCGRCNGESAFDSVVITECEGEETNWCRGIRLLAAIAAALSIFAAALAICLPMIAPLLLGIAAVLGIASGLLFWWHSGERCKSRTCRPKTLSIAQATIMAGFAMIQFSSPDCCPELLGFGLAAVGGGLALLNYWRTKCHKTWCQYFAKLVAVLAGYAMIFGILKSALQLDAFSELVPCYNDDVTGYIFFVLGTTGLIGIFCEDKDEGIGEFV